MAKKSKSKARGGAKTTTASRPQSAPPPPVEAPVETWTTDDPRFWQVASALWVLGIALRQWKLAAFPYHPDEAIHAWFALGFKDYNYDPVYHGPVLYHLLASTFALLGANDYTARLVSSLLGIGLLAMILGPARRWLGDRAALWSMGLVAMSPVMVAYQRRVLHDALVLVLTFGAVLCFQAAREQPSHTLTGRRARIGLAVLLSAFVATKANAFFIIAMLFGFWLAVQLRCLWLRLFPAHGVVPDDTASFAGLVRAGLPLFLLIYVGFASVFALRDPPEVGKVREFIFTIVCGLGTLAMWLWVWWTPGESEATEATEEATEDDAPRGFDWLTPPLAVAAACLTFAFFFGHGYQWWQIPLKYLGFIKTDVGVVTAAQQLADVWTGVKTALPKMFEYWGGQQKHPRLPGRHDYYLVLMALYELPIAIAAIGGIVHASRRRSPFTDLLLWWAFTSFALYALANEKVPWLMSHIMLPLALLAGWWLSQLRFTRPAGQRAFIVVCALGAIFLLRGVSATNFERAADHREPLLYAQVTEQFRDEFFARLSTAPREGPVWIDTDGSQPNAQWPCAWYLRDKAPNTNGAVALFGTAPGDGPLRMAVAAQPKIDQNKRFKNWTHKNVIFYMWPRADWRALRPERYWKWWWNRDAFYDDGVQPGILSEWSNNEVVIVTPPDAAK